MLHGRRRGVARPGTGASGAGEAKHRNAIRRRSGVLPRAIEFLFSPSSALPLHSLSPFAVFYVYLPPLPTAANRGCWPSTRGVRFGFQILIHKRAEYSER